MTEQDSQAGGGREAEPSDTVTKVELAVLDMLEREGVLAGINLNEVAKHAGVNRSLVYHHFGSRRGLLRSAIRRRLRELNVELRTPSQPMKLGARVVHALKAVLQSRETIKMTTLLHLDGSSSPKLMPNAAMTLTQLERDQALGLLPDVQDLPALHASYAATVYGYALFRDVFSRDLGIPVDELDRRMAACLEDLYNSRKDDRKDEGVVTR